MINGDISSFIIHGIFIENYCIPILCPKKPRNASEVNKADTRDYVITIHTDISLHGTIAQCKCFVEFSYSFVFW